MPKEVSNVADIKDITEELQDENTTSSVPEILDQKDTEEDSLPQDISVNLVNTASTEPQEQTTVRSQDELLKKASTIASNATTTRQASKIARIAKQIFNASRNIQQAASVSINSMVKYCSQSKGYVEDVADEFTFLKALPSQSTKPLIQDTFKAFNPDLRNIAKVKSTQLLDPAETRKLIYARFADEISDKSKNVVDIMSQDRKEHAKACNTYDITEEFKMFKEQGYDFEATKKAIENKSSKSICERMKELSISGFFSSYAGQPDFRENLKKVSIQKDLVINEFMATITSHIEDPEEYSTELLG